MRKVRENILVSSGNQSLFTAGQDVFIKDTAGTTLNGVLPNQLVIYDPDTGQSLGAGITLADNPRIVIAQGIDTTGDGLADQLRKGFGEGLYGSTVRSLKAKEPVCGITDVVDIAANCVNCDEDFFVNITVEDDNTQNQYPFNRPATYTYSVNTACCDCDTCDGGVDCQALFCKLANQINGVSGTANVAKQGAFLASAARRAAESRPFYAYPLYDKDITYCLDPIDGTCETCFNIASIASVVIDGNVHTFTNTLDPNDGTLSLQAQIPRIVALINKAFEDEGGVGSAVVTRGVDGNGNCCSYQLRINTCKTFVLRDHAAATITACIPEANPFTAITLEQDCKGCATAASVTPTCGLRFVSKPVDIDCNCDTPPDTPRGYLSRKIDVFAGKNGGGFACSAFYKTRIQEATIPQNLGYEWETRAANQDVGGKGRDYDPWMQDSQGRFGNPRKTGRAKNAAPGLSCKQLYCSYAFEHNLPWSDITVHNTVSAARGRTVVLIPSSDTVTKTEFEAIINGYFAAKGSIPDINCGGEVDLVLS